LTSSLDTAFEIGIKADELAIAGVEGGAGGHFVEFWASPPVTILYVVVEIVRFPRCRFVGQNDSRSLRFDVLGHQSLSHNSSLLIVYFSHMKAT